LTRWISPSPPGGCRRRHSDAPECLVETATGIDGDELDFGIIFGSKKWSRYLPYEDALELFDRVNAGIADVRTVARVHRRT
jgi:hypothetical protein